MPARHTKNVVLTDELSDFVDSLVTSGRYTSVSEVMRDGLRTLQDRIARDQAELAEIRARIDRSLDQLDRGDCTSGSPAELIGNAFEDALGAPED